ncbi:hypothetical protein KVT40_009268 [Elsinoe batatas]|uniref:Uncharacterized protein n=1 Tax=Elsinoe batatas TaxID=2601811 RepID=A0A8K0PB30_9PEZI|nr:hypothetical protein KVT40_009268 [Elsinoe batatas]
MPSAKTRRKRKDDRLDNAPSPKRLCFTASAPSEPRLCHTPDHPSDVDPEETAQIWSDVRRHKLDLLKSSKRPAPPEEDMDIDGTTISSEPSGSTLPSSVTQRNKRGRGNKESKAKLEATILHDVYNIHLDRAGDEIGDAYEHFGTRQLAKEGDLELDVVQRYRTVHTDCNIWLALDKSTAEDYAAQYMNMLQVGENEAKFSHRGKQYFFKEDDLRSPADSTRCSSAYFKLEWGPSPNDDTLLSPPVLHVGRAPDLSFYVKPDCTYWLTSRRLSPDIRPHLMGMTYMIHNKLATAPYLTIEFKKDNQTEEAAQNQVIKASTLILYNRLLLRRRRLVALGREPKSLKTEDFSDLRHYGITFVGGSATVFKIVPKLRTSADIASEVVPEHFPWNGACMSKLATLDVVEATNIIDLRRWVNEIHNWGLGPNNISFVRDVKGTLLRKGHATGKISLSPEDKRVLGLEPDHEENEDSRRE